MNMWITSAAFLRPGEVVLAWTDDETDPQYPLSQQTLAYLEGETDARGRKLVILRSIRSSGLHYRGGTGRLFTCRGGGGAGGGESVLRHPTNFYFPTRQSSFRRLAERMRRATGVTTALLAQWNGVEDYPGAGACDFSRRREYPLYYTADPGGKKVSGLKEELR